MNLNLTDEEIELLLFCLEQQEFDFNDYESELAASIFDKFITCQSDSNHPAN